MAIAKTSRIASAEARQCCERQHGRRCGEHRGHDGTECCAARYTEHVRIRQRVAQHGLKHGSTQGEPAAGEGGEGARAQPQRSSSTMARSTALPFSHYGRDYPLERQIGSADGCTQHDGADGHKLR